MRYNIVEVSQRVHNSPYTIQYNCSIIYIKKKTNNRIIKGYTLLIHKIHNIFTKPRELIIEGGGNGEKGYTLVNCVNCELKHGSASKTDPGGHVGSKNECVRQFTKFVKFTKFTCDVKQFISSHTVHNSSH